MPTGDSANTRSPTRSPSIFFRSLDPVPLSQPTETIPGFHHFLHASSPPLHSVSDITSTGTREVMRSDSLSFLRPSDHRPHARSRLLPGSVEGGCPSSCPKLTPARALEGTRASPPPQGSTLSLVHPPPPHLHLPLLIRLLPHCTQRLKSLPSQNK